MHRTGSSFSMQNAPSDSSLNYCLPSHHFAMNSCFLNAFRKAKERLITEFVVMTIKTEQRRTASTAVVNFNSFSLSGHFGFIYRGMKFPLDACVKGEPKLNYKQMKFGHFHAHRPVHVACHYRAAQIAELFPSQKSGKLPSQQIRRGIRRSQLFPFRLTAELHDNSAHQKLPSYHWFSDISLLFAHLTCAREPEKSWNRTRVRK